MRLRVWIGSAERLSAPSPDEIGAREKNVSPARSIERALRGSASKRPWLRGLDLNQRPSGYEPDELPGCSTPHPDYSGMGNWRQIYAGSGQRKTVWGITWSGKPRERSYQVL